MSASGVLEERRRDALVNGIAPPMPDLAGVSDDPEFGGVDVRLRDDAADRLVAGFEKQEENEDPGATVHPCIELLGNVNGGDSWWVGSMSGPPAAVGALVRYLQACMVHFARTAVHQAIGRESGAVSVAADGRAPEPVLVETVESYNGIDRPHFHCRLFEPDVDDFNAKWRKYVKEDCDGLPTIGLEAWFSERNTEAFDIAKVSGPAQFQREFVDYMRTCAEHFVAAAENACAAKGAAIRGGSAAVCGGEFAALAPGGAAKSSHCGGNCNGNGCTGDAKAADRVRV